MRVISGSLRGRTIKAVPGMNTRPTLDKVKESVFNALGQYFEGGIALDLYAGSGNLGIEALSRGMDHCYFIDQNFKAYQIIKENIETLSLKNESTLLKMDAFKALNYFVEKNISFDIVFLDPPYQKQKINEIIIYLEDNNLLTPNCTIVCECIKEDELLIEYKSIHFTKDYIYGMTKITIFNKSGEEHE